MLKSIFCCHSAKTPSFSHDTYCPPDSSFLLHLSSLCSHVYRTHYQGQAADKSVFRAQKYHPGCYSMHTLQSVGKPRTDITGGHKAPCCSSETHDSRGHSTAAPWAPFPLGETPGCMGLESTNSWKPACRGPSAAFQRLSSCCVSRYCRVISLFVNEGRKMAPAAEPGQEKKS